MSTCHEQRCLFMTTKQKVFKSLESSLYKFYFPTTLFTFFPFTKFNTQHEKKHRAETMMVFICYPSNGLKGQPLSGTENSNCPSTQA